MEGHTGELCEIYVSPCVDQVCVNGTVVDTADGCACECMSGYQGELCDVPVEAVFNDVGSGFCTDDSGMTPAKFQCQQLRSTRL
eukprot:UN06941